MLTPFHQQGVPGWPFNALEAALDKASKEPSARAAFMALLPGSEIFVLGPRKPAAESGAADAQAQVDAGQPITVPTVNLASGPAVIVFTSAELLSKSTTEEHTYFNGPARDFFASMPGARLALNPCGPVGKEITPEEVQRMLAGAAPDGRMDVPAGTSVLLGALAEEPTALIDAVRAVCAGDASIREVYLCAISMPGGGDARPHPLLGIDAEDFAHAREKIGKAVEAWAQAHKQAVDMVEMRGAGTLQDHLSKHGRMISK